MNSRAAIKILLLFVLGLPVLQAVLTWVSGLLEAMGDAPAAGVLSGINTAIRVIWLVTIVGLVVALAIQSVDEPREE